MSQSVVSDEEEAVGGNHMKHAWWNGNGYGSVTICIQVHVHAGIAHAS